MTKKRFVLPRIAAPLAFVFLASTAFAEDFRVAPNAGNNTFNAVFDAKLGERIVATSSSVDCTATYDEKAGTFSGSCKVPLLSIMVDNEPTKSEHFQQWSTNNKSKPKDCVFEATFKDVAVGKLVAESPATFTAEVPFTTCGRSRKGGGNETVTGTALLFPAGTYGEAKTVQVRATVQKFNRDSYKIGPKHTEGWLARVQALASVVAEEGSIELSLFATAKEEEKAAAKTKP